MTSRRFNRHDASSTRFIVKSLWPDNRKRRRALEILRRAVQIAHEIDDASWGVTLTRDRVRLNVGRGAVVSLGANSLELALDDGPHLTLNAGEIDERFSAIQSSHEARVSRSAREFGDSNFRNPSWRAAHSPGVLAFLREEFGDAPAPSYALQNAESASSTNEFDLGVTLRAVTSNAGLHLPPEHVATFYTALLTRGFVILSGLSGTGKTRLALDFARALPSSHESNGETLIDEDFRTSGRLILPPEAARLAIDGRANLEIGGKTSEARVENGALIVRGAARKAVLESFSVGANVAVDAEIDESGRAHFKLFAPISSADSNTLFVPVRAEWNDARALLGGFNPLLNRYEWTPFLRFLVRAGEAFRAGEAGAFFVILDEMNLARVEFYFADFLSVLEAGRDANGVSREPLRFEFDARTSGELPPRELVLPPNLYFIGTLNADDSTHPLSPKVLDRAWILDAPRVDFCDYQSASPPIALGRETKRELERRFTSGRAFAGASSTIARELETAPMWRTELQNLNAILDEEDAGFGFRAFDEIVTFVALARENGLMTPQTAFDRAVAAKILPRLGGTRTSAEIAIRALFDWATRLELSETARGAKRKLRRLERDGWV